MSGCLSAVKLGKHHFHPAHVMVVSTCRYPYILAPVWVYPYILAPVWVYPYILVPVWIVSSHTDPRHFQTKGSQFHWRVHVLYYIVPRWFLYTRNNLEGTVTWKASNTQGCIIMDLCLVLHRAATIHVVCGLGSYVYCTCLDSWKNQCFKAKTYIQLHSMKIL